jgi:hypothetical protein
VGRIQQWKGYQKAKAEKAKKKKKIIGAPRTRTRISQTTDILMIRDKDNGER